MSNAPQGILIFSDDLTYSQKSAIVALNVGRVNGFLGAKSTGDGGIGIYTYRKPRGQATLLHAFHFSTPEKGGERFRVTYHAGHRAVRGEDVRIVVYITKDDRLIIEALSSGVLVSSEPLHGRAAMLLCPPVARSTAV